MLRQAVAIPNMVKAKFGAFVSGLTGDVTEVRSETSPPKVKSECIHSNLQKTSSVSLFAFILHPFPLPMN